MRTRIWCGVTKNVVRGTGLEHHLFTQSLHILRVRWVMPTAQRNQNWASWHSYSKHATCQSSGFACNQFVSPGRRIAREVVSWYLSQLEVSETVTQRFPVLPVRLASTGNMRAFKRRPACASDCRFGLRNFSLESRKNRFEESILD